MLVILTKDEQAKATEIGLARRKNAREHDNADRNNLEATDRKKALMDCVAASGEMAFHKLLPWCRWEQQQGHPYHLPDFVAGHVQIDIKTPLQHPNEGLRGLINEAGYIKPDWAYVLVLPQGDCAYEIVGWTWGGDLQLAPVKELQHGRPAHRMKPEVPPLRPIEELMSLTNEEYANAWRARQPSRTGR